MGAASSQDSNPYANHRAASSSYQRTSHYATTQELQELGVREKRKKTSKLATLRKKLTRTRRHSKTFDHGKAIRELTSSWTIRELNALVEEYEASSALKELQFQADLARQSANTYKQDLHNLFEKKYCSDVDLIYAGSCFPSHRVILSARCPYFRNLLERYPQYGAQIPVTIRTPGVDVHMFNVLLRYLYTGEIRLADQKLEHRTILAQLGEEFGVAKPLDYDLRALLETGHLSDAVIVFTSEVEYHESNDVWLEGHLVPNNELRCHKAILAARSPFFRNLLLRRARTGEELSDQALQVPTYIVLDESVIPKQYARVLLHSLYLDHVDLNQIVHSSVSMCSLSEVQAMVAGKGHMTHTDEAMEIYQIGQFLDYPALAQGCEDIIVETLNTENLMSVLQWSSESHGSQWVHRQVFHFMQEEFLQIVHSPILYELSREYFVRLIKSDFLQAGELDVLNAILRWGEHQLIRRMEEREPNLLSHTTHSVSRKGIKKRDLNDIELREILAEVLPFLRTDHIIPTSSDLLCQAIKRGLISTPPSHMIRDESSTSHVEAWTRTKNTGMFVKPRLFTAYHEEAKALLDEQIAQVQENELVHMRPVHMSTIPDTLYMVEDKTFPPPHTPCMPSVPIQSWSQSTVDIIAGAIPVPDDNTLRAMFAREHELKSCKGCKNAMTLHYSDRRAITLAIQLRVVREFGLPDVTVEILQSSRPCAYTLEEPVLTCPRQLPKFHRPPVRAHRDRAAERKKKWTECHPASTPVSPVKSFSPIEKETSACSDSVLSEMMPDIAMATATLNQITLQDTDTLHTDLELDLGDGNKHSGTGTLYI